MNAAKGRARISACIEGRSSIRKWSGRYMKITQAEVGLRVLFSL
jgi:hypothetical protein